MKINFMIFYNEIYPRVQEVIYYFLSPNQLISTFKEVGLPGTYSVYIPLIFSQLFRFILSIVFVGSFLLKPLIMRPLSLVWARIIESEKPVFTVIFGGAAAFATAISEAAKHL
jgi:hypothetical protein